MTTIRTLALALGVALSSVGVGAGPIAGQGWDLSGNVALESRFFPRSTLDPVQSGARVSPSFRFEGEAVYEWGRGAHRLSASPFARIDAHDDHRTHLDFRELGYLYLGADWTGFVGLGTVFWGVTESNHLVDIVNQTDAVEDIDGEDKLGQPMLNVTLERSWGALDLFYLPAFRERTFVDRDARLRGALPWSDDARYESGAGEFRQDWAVRWAHVIGDFDLALGFFQGTSREPTPSLGTEAGRPVLVPTYEVIDQTSLELQWTRGSTLWKVEALTRGGHGSRFGAFVAGLEHTLFQIGSGSSDLGLLAEFLYDGRDEAAPITLFDNDLFTGVRWAWNDVADTSILGGPIVDLDTGEVLAFLEAERRAGDRWTLEFEARWFANPSPASPIDALRRDGFVTLRAAWHY